jgi:hypothetical protein
MGDYIEDYDSSDGEDFPDAVYKRAYHMPLQCTRISVKMNAKKFSHRTKFSFCCARRKQKKNIVISSINSVYTFDNVGGANIASLICLTLTGVGILVIAAVQEPLIAIAIIPVIALILFVLFVGRKWGMLNFKYGGNGDWSVIIPRNHINDINTLVSDTIAARV